MKEYSIEWTERRIITYSGQLAADSIEDAIDKIKNDTDGYRVDSGSEQGDEPDEYTGREWIEILEIKKVA